MLRASLRQNTRLRKLCTGNNTVCSVGDELASRKDYARADGFARGKSIRGPEGYLPHKFAKALAPRAFHSLAQHPKQWKRDQQERQRVRLGNGRRRDAWRITRRIAYFRVSQPLMPSCSSPGPSRPATGRKHKNQGNKGLAVRRRLRSHERVRARRWIRSARDHEFRKSSRVHSRVHG